jgi:membrane-associated protein
LVCTLVGYWAGNIPWVKDNFTWFILAMFTIGFTPIVIGYMRNQVVAKRRAAVKAGDQGAGEGGAA